MRKLKDEPIAEEQRSRRGEERRGGAGGERSRRGESLKWVKM